jgi:hypothetical protein
LISNKETIGGDAVAIKEIGCCGAYCKTCIEEWQKKKRPDERTCLGCKLGYESGKRDNWKGPRGTLKAK